MEKTYDLITEILSEKNIIRTVYINPIDIRIYQ